MKNCGLSELRLVEPREKWPNDDASSMAAGADDILKNIKVFENIPSALSDVIHIFSLTALWKCEGLQIKNHTHPIIRKTSVAGRDSLKVHLS